MEKDVKLALIAGVTALVVCSWLIVDFILFVQRRRKKAHEQEEYINARGHVLLRKEQQRTEQSHSDKTKVHRGETRVHRYKLKPKATKKKVKVSINRFRKD